MKFDCDITISDVEYEKLKPEKDTIPHDDIVTLDQSRYLSDIIDTGEEQIPTFGCCS